MIETWIGCSGFHYKEWKDVFYPQGLPQRKWFDYYSKHFNTLELNTTFYRFPQLRFLQNWYDNSPTIYRFSAKAPRLITHYKQFKDCERLLSDFYGTAKEGLKDKLGCILFQLPGRTSYSEETLDRIIENLDPAFTNVIEFRHESWWNKHVFEKLMKYNIHFCSISYPGLMQNVIYNSSLIYYRFHGVPRLYKSCYKKEFVLELADQFLANANTSQLYVYFNNTWGTGALKNGRQLMKYYDQSSKKKIITLQKTM